MKPCDKDDSYANVSQMACRMKDNPLWKSKHNISLNLKQLCLMFIW